MIDLCIFYNEHRSEFFGAWLGIIISAVIWACSELRKIIFNWKTYRGYSGNYISYLKQNPDRQHFKITLKRHGNKFKVTGHSIAKNEKIEGEIEMSSSIKNYGTGYYFHIVSDENKPQKFGFYELQLNQKHIFVHQNIKGLINENELGIDRSAAYVWIKQK